MKGPGGRFERQVLASVPRWAWGRKVPDPPARPFKCRCGGDIAPRCSRCGSQHGHPATFTRRNPWDIEIRWRGANLAKAEAAGALAGVLWEVRGAESVVHYLPIGLWLELERTVGRKSLPLAVAAARGLRVAVDPKRGSKHTYYKIDELLRTGGRRHRRAHDHREAARQGVAVDH